MQDALHEIRMMTSRIKVNQAIEASGMDVNAFEASFREWAKEVIELSDQVERIGKIAVFKEHNPSIWNDVSQNPAIEKIADNWMIEKGRSFLKIAAERMYEKIAPFGKDLTNDDVLIFLASASAS
jgi:hypothetical protein